MNNKTKFLISLLLVVAMAAVMLFTEKKAGGEQGVIVKIELAPSIEVVKQLTAPYDEEHIEWLRLNTKFDFIFILTYTSLFFFALQGLTERLRKENGLKWIPLIAFAPGVLDVIENLFILRFLSHDYSTGYFNTYYWCVHTKWWLVGVFVILSLAQLVRIVLKK